MSTLKMRKAKDSVFLLNKMFHEFEIAPEEFYLQIKARGFDTGLSILISICPDGDNTYIGSLINQLGEMFSFDIDCDDEKYSRWDFMGSVASYKSKFHRKLKPWDSEVIAIDIFEKKLTR